MNSQITVVFKVARITESTDTLRRGEVPHPHIITERVGKPRPYEEKPLLLRHNFILIDGFLVGSIINAVGIAEVFEFH